MSQQSVKPAVSGVGQTVSDLEEPAGLFSVTAQLDAVEPVVFWRDRWHWPWWSAGEFERRLDVLTRAVEDVATEVRGGGIPTLVYDDSAHPAGWLVQLAAQRLGFRARARSASPPPDEADAQQEIGSASALLCRPLAETTSLVSTVGSVPAGASSWERAGGTVSNWVDEIERAWRAQRPLAADRRPVVLLAGATSGSCHHVAARWGGPRRAAWLFGETGGHWLQDLLWARSHVAFAGAREVEALGTALTDQAGHRWGRDALRRRRLRRGLQRLRLLVCCGVAESEVADLSARMRDFGVDVVGAGSLKVEEPA